MNTNQARTRSGLFATVRRAARIILDLVYPPRCVHCARIDHHFCPRCIGELQALPIHPAQRTTPPLLHSLTTGTHDGILRDAVIALKYRGAQHVAIPLAQRIVQIISPNVARYDLVVAVPLHPQREAQRGFNQAALLARSIAQQTNCLDASESILRIRPTRPQVGLNTNERRTNLEGAFVADEMVFRRQRILLVDDVQTTGTTLSTCAMTLLTAGASTVTGITVTDVPLRLKN